MKIQPGLLVPAGHISYNSLHSNIQNYYVVPPGWHSGKRGDPSGA